MSEQGAVETDPFNAKFNALWNSAKNAEAIAAKTRGVVYQGPFAVFVKTRESVSFDGLRSVVVEHIGFEGDPNAIRADKNMQKVLEADFQSVYDMSRSGTNPRKVASEVKKRTGLKIGPRLEEESVGVALGAPGEVTYFALERSTTPVFGKEPVGVIGVRLTPRR
jgi:ABC-type Zn uptake system ZnuABC Zn-binding protein ZnuA